MYKKLKFEEKKEFLDVLFQTAMIDPQKMYSTNAIYFISDQTASEKISSVLSWRLKTWNGSAGATGMNGEIFALQHQKPRERTRHFMFFDAT